MLILLCWSSLVSKEKAEKSSTLKIKEESSKRVKQILKEDNTTTEKIKGGQGSSTKKRLGKVDTPPNNKSLSGKL